MKNLFQTMLDYFFNFVKNNDTVRTIFLALMFLLILFPLFRIFCAIKKRVHYRHSQFAKQNGLSYHEMKQDKGSFGEYTTSEILYDFPFYFKILHNVYLPISKRDMTEVDMIIFSIKGILVIENKNYSGWIYGSEYDKEWCKTFPNQKFYFYNPIWQNRGHINAINQVLKRNPKEYLSVVVFNQASIKDMSVDSRNTFVLDQKTFRTFIKLLNRRTDKYSEAEVDDMYELLLPYGNATKRVKKKHIKRMKKRAARGFRKGFWER